MASKNLNHKLIERNDCRGPETFLNMIKILKNGRRKIDTKDNLSNGEEGN